MQRLITASLLKHFILDTTHIINYVEVSDPLTPYFS